MVSEKKIGKLTIEEMKNLLKQINIDENVLLGPRIGADAAILRTGNVIAVHVDPITGARKNLGALSITIASNDIVAAGARPKFALTCIILPTHYKKEDLSILHQEILHKAREFKINLVGGHTEFSPSVKEPIVITFMLGELIGNYEERIKQIKDLKNNPENYYIVQIKPIALEATAIIANDFEELLLGKINEEDIRKAKSLLNELSVFNPGIKIFENNIAVYAHDPTEGGIIVALKEMGNFLETGFEVWEEKIFKLDVTEKIFNVLNLNPLKALSSGSLICVVVKNKIDLLQKILSEEGKNWSIIGSLKRERNMIIINKEGKSRNLEEEGEEEEVWKLFRP